MRNKSLFLLTFFLFSGVFAVSPSIDSVVLNSSSGTNTSSEDLTAYPINVIPSNSSIDYQWYKNGIAFVEEVWSVTSVGASTDDAKGIAVDGFGNVYVTGSSNSNGLIPGIDYHTIKYDSNGVEIWAVTSGDAFSEGEDFAFAIAVDGFGNVYVTGYSTTNGGGDRDYHTIKYDSSGNEIWAVTSEAVSHDIAYAIAVDNSGNVYVTGTSQSIVSIKESYYTIKYDSNGNEIWTVTTEGEDNDIAYGVAVDGFGNVYVTGASQSNGGSDQDYYTVKYDSSGVEVWSVTSVGASADYAYGVAVDGFGNVYVTGSSASNGGGDGDYHTIKYDSSGVEVWNATTNLGVEEDVARSVALDGSGNVYVTGIAESFPPFDAAYHTIKYDSNGVEVWNVTFNGTDNNEANAIAVDGFGNVYVTGSSFLSGGTGTDFDYHTIKYVYGGSVLESSFTTLGETWQVEVIPYNPEFSGSSIFSNSLTIEPGKIKKSKNKTKKYC